MAKLLSPAEVWKDVNINSDNFDESVIKQYETEDSNYKEIYFNGKKTNDGITRIFAVLATPKKISNPPVVLLCHDFSSSINKSYIDYFLKMNFAVMMCDMYGHFNGRKYTFYPDEIKYANMELAENHLFETENSARETLPFEWTVVNRYALQYLKSQPNIDSSRIACIGIGEGATVTWQLAYIEKDLKACVSLLYAGWGEYGKNYKFGTESDITNMTSERATYIAGVSPQSYAPYVNVPMLYLAASNNQLGNLDRAFDTMARINGAVNSMMCVTPNSVNQIGCLATRDLKLWLNMHLTDSEIEMPENPAIKFENFAGKLLCKCDVENSESVQNVRLFYSFGTVIPSARCWFERELKSGSNCFLGSVEICDSTKPLFAFCNVEYKNGYTICSNYISLIPKTLGIEKKLIKENLIYNGTMGIDTFVDMKGLISTGANDMFTDKYTVKLIEGANGIEGISSTNNLATFKLAASNFSGEEGNRLLMDIWSIDEQTINVIVFCNLGENNETVFATELKPIGADAWQKFKIDVGDFKDSNKISLERWSDIKLIMFKGKSTWALNNLLWI